MSIKVREFNENDIQAANEIWNEVVEEGVAFPQEECLTEKSGLEFFKSQSYTGIAYDEERVILSDFTYFLHLRPSQMRSYLQCKLCGEINTKR